MYILKKLLILIIFRKCISFNYVNVNYKYNFNKNLINDKTNGYDFRFPKKEDKKDLIDLKIFHEKKKLLDKLNSDIPIINKIKLIETAKLNNILDSEKISTNLFNGGLLDDFNFIINN